MDSNPDLRGRAGGRFRYRLNPYFFLADRKLWVLVGATLLAIFYGLVTHYIAFSAAHGPASLGTYLIAVALIGGAPLVVHIVAPWLGEEGRRVRVAKLVGGSRQWVVDVDGKGDWRPLHTLGAAQQNALAARIQKRLGLLPARAVDINAILGRLDHATRMVAEHAAEVSGRDPADMRSATIHLELNDLIGSPYCRARAVGPLTIVWPLGTAIVGSEGVDATDLAAVRDAQVDNLLSHELAHALLRDAPFEVFSDARLLSVAHALQGPAAAMLALTALPAVLPSVLRELSGSESGTTDVVEALGSAYVVPLIGLLAIALVVGGLGWRLIFTGLRRAVVSKQSRARPIPRAWTVIATFLFSVPVAMLGGGAIFLLGLTAGMSESGGGTSSWPVLWVSLFLAAGLCHLSVFLGRRQMEFMADEAAINALSQSEGDRARGNMVSALRRATNALLSANVPLRDAPPYAVGHRAHDADWMEILKEVRLFEMPEERPVPADEPQSAPPLTWQARFAQLVEGSVRIAEGLVRPLTRTHPSLAQRMAVAMNPDRQVLQDPIVPLFYASVPLVILPYVRAQLDSDAVLTQLAFWVLVLPLFGFTTLFLIVSRRPSRTVDPLRNVAVQAAGSPKSAWQRVALRVRNWWRKGVDEADPLVGADADPPSDTAGFIQDMQRIVAVLAVAAGVGALFIVAMNSLLGTPNRPVEFPYLQYLPPLGVIGLTAVLTAMFFWLYTMNRFSELLRWNYLSGSSWIIRTLSEAATVFVAAVWAAMIACAVALLWYVGSTTFLELFPFLPDLSADALLAPHRIEAQVALLIVGLFVLFAVIYAMTVFWSPVRPSFTRCPNGHPVFLRWRNVLRQPRISHDEDWAWVTCEQCGRPPQAPQRLRSDEDVKTNRMAPNRGLSYYTTALVVAITVLPAVTGLRSAAGLLRDRSNCVELSSLHTGIATQGFWGASAGLPGQCRVTSDLPEPPDRGSWTPLISATSVPPAEKAAVAARLVSMDLAYGALFDDVTCKQGLARSRNRIAYLESCAQMAPSSPPTADECGGLLDDQDPSRACACLWATPPNQTEPATAWDLTTKSEVRASRIQAAQVLYSLATSALHNARGVCFEDEEVDAWTGWHQHLESGTAPRVFIGIASRESEEDPFGNPSRYFDDPEALAEGPGSECSDEVSRAVRLWNQATSNPDPNSDVREWQAKTVSHWKDGRPAFGLDDARASWRLLDCLNPPFIERFVADAEVAITIHDALNRDSTHIMVSEPPMQPGKIDRAAHERHLETMKVLSTLGLVRKSLDELRASLTGLRDMVNVMRLAQSTSPQREDELSYCEESEQTNAFFSWITKNHDTLPLWYKPSEPPADAEPAKRATYEAQKAARAFAVMHWTDRYCELIPYQGWPDPLRHWLALQTCASRNPSIVDDNEAILLSACQAAKADIGPANKLDPDRRLGRLCTDAGLSATQCQDAFAIPDECTIGDIEATAGKIERMMLGTRFASRMRDAEGNNGLALPESSAIAQYRLDGRRSRLGAVQRQVAARESRLFRAEIACGRVPVPRPRARGYDVDRVNLMFCSDFQRAMARQIKRAVVAKQRVENGEVRTHLTPGQAMELVVPDRRLTETLHLVWFDGVSESPNGFGWQYREKDRWGSEYSSREIEKLTSTLRTCGATEPTEADAKRRQSLLRTALNAKLGTTRLLASGAHLRAMEALAVQLVLLEQPEKYKAVTAGPSATNQVDWERFKQGVLVGTKLESCIEVPITADDVSSRAIGKACPTKLTESMETKFGDLDEMTRGTNLDQCLAKGEFANRWWTIFELIFFGAGGRPDLVLCDFVFLARNTENQRQATTQAPTGQEGANRTGEVDAQAKKNGSDQSGQSAAENSEGTLVGEGSQTGAKKVDDKEGTQVSAKAPVEEVDLEPEDAWVVLASLTEMHDWFDAQKDGVPEFLAENHGYVEDYWQLRRD